MLRQLIVSILRLDFLGILCVLLPELGDFVDDVLCVLNDRCFGLLAVVGLKAVLESIDDSEVFALDRGAYMLVHSNS